MKINFKDKPFWGGFITGTILLPFLLLGLLFLLESVFLRYGIDLEIGASYVLVYLVFLIISAILSFAFHMLEFEQEFRCISCWKIFDKGELINLTKEGKEDYYYSEICKDCLKKVKDKALVGKK